MIIWYKKFIRAGHSTCVGLTTMENQCKQVTILGLREVRAQRESSEYMNEIRALTRAG